jgi:hypothetical protein
MSTTTKSHMTAMDGWAAGRGGRSACDPTPADEAAKSAQDDSVLAYKMSKASYTSNGGHQRAAKMLREAADSHNKAADLYNREGNWRRAQEERANADVRLEAADRHEHYDGTPIEVPASIGGGSRATDFLSEAKGLAARESISLDRACSIVSAKCPDLYAAYRAQHGSPSAVATAGSRPEFYRSQVHAEVSNGGSGATEFLAEAKAFAARESISLDRACSIVSAKRPDLYATYRAQFPRR